MTADELLFEKEGPVAVLTINREASLNALTGRLLVRIGEIFAGLEEDPETRVVILTGAGVKAFAAGADVKEIKEAGPERTAFIEKGQKIVSAVRKSGKVTIAAVNGYALGGGLELALACDIRIAAENARFGLPEVTLGVMAGYGGTQLLSRLIGPGRAKYMMLTGAMLSAPEALAFGLVERVWPADALMGEVKALAAKIATFGPLALAGCKRAVDAGAGLPIEEALKVEIGIYDKVANSPDAEEGLSAFMEKRKPRFGTK